MAALPRQRPRAFHLQGSGSPVKVQNCDFRSSTFVQGFKARLWTSGPQAPPPPPASSRFQDGKSAAVAPGRNQGRVNLGHFTSREVANIAWLTLA